ncbi:MULTISPECIES: hypothetical protein [Gracilibacillus]|uniref:hypothetical protein n=1 Tax=Gracilibacillus TaxID=74385 RepID=UPI000B22E72D|nr:hypothetical protein [Gracilibacillus dipsosauri]
MMEFLYFPEDKAEYIPAVISLIVFVIGAFVAMHFIRKASKKEEEKFDQKYKNTNSK